jgi:hypothetical protein
MYQDQEDNFSDQECYVLEEAFDEEFFSELELQSTDPVENLRVELSINEDEKIQKIKTIIRAALHGGREDDVKLFYNLFRIQEEPIIDLLFNILAEEEFQSCFHKISWQNKSSFIDFLYETSMGYLSDKVYLYLKECFSENLMDENSLVHLIITDKSYYQSNSTVNILLDSMKKIVHESDDSHSTVIAYMRALINNVTKFANHRHSHIILELGIASQNSALKFMTYFKEDSDYIILMLPQYPNFLSDFKNNFPREFYYFLLDIKTHALLTAEEYIKHYFSMSSEQLEWTVKAVSFEQCYKKSEKINWIENFHFYLTYYPEIEHRMSDIFNWLFDEPRLLIKFSEKVREINLELFIKSFFNDDTFASRINLKEIGRLYYQALLKNIIPEHFATFFNLMNKDLLPKNYEKILIAFIASAELSNTPRMDKIFINNSIAYIEFAQSRKSERMREYFINNSVLIDKLVKHPESRHYFSALAIELLKAQEEPDEKWAEFIHSCCKKCFEADEGVDNNSVQEISLEEDNFKAISVADLLAKAVVSEYVEEESTKEERYVSMINTIKSSQLSRYFRERRQLLERQEAPEALNLSISRRP